MQFLQEQKNAEKMSGTLIFNVRYAGNMFI